GTVADQTGAAVAEAKLTLTNIDTGVALETLSNSSGTYRFPNVPPGKYKLRVTKPGFQTVIHESIVLESGRVQSVPISLAVGAMLLPNPDSVEEVRVSTNDYSAQWGKNAGILTQVVSKTGTNEYHGTLYWFHRNNKLTSRTYLQSTVNPALGRAFPAYRRNDFGGSVGGPIRKEKTFFFMTFDELRSSRGFANVVTVETPQFADFMKTRYPNNVSTNLL